MKRDGLIEKGKHRLFLLDIIRIICALLVYARHSITMFGCTYGQMLDAIVCRTTSPVMTCFFLLSGFTIHYQHRTETVSSEWIRNYLQKRMISILPSYLLVVLVWPIIYPSQMMKWVALLPVDVIGVQTVYRSLFGVLHNGGTWFVSCLLLAYVVYPIMKAVLQTSSKWVAIVLILIPYFLLIYSNAIIIPVFSLDSLYSNPIARTAEFLIGVSISDIIFRNNKESKIIDNTSGIVNAGNNGREAVFVILLSITLSMLLYILGQSSIDMLFESYLVIPLVMTLFLFAARIRCLRLERSKVLSVMSGITYQFFLVQCFLWDFSAKTLNAFNWNRNIAKIIVSLTICFTLSIFICYCYDKPVKKRLRKLSGM